MDPERAHDVTMAALHRLSPLLTAPAQAHQSIDLMGLELPHRLGLAAGFDKNGAHVDLLFKLGFAFVEVGTVTPEPQEGNPKPRIFRLVDDESLMNCMGFPNLGMHELRQNLQRRRSKGIVGINIGKNKTTPLANSASDYIQCLSILYDQADYFVVNISSPNTPNLRSLQDVGAFTDLVSKIDESRKGLEDKYGIRRPIAYKVSPDLDGDALKEWLDVCMDQGVDGIVATNTSTKRPKSAKGHYQGGVSGALLTKNAEAHLETIVNHVGSDLSVVSVGGIMTKEDGQRRIGLGASALQIFTGFIYRGPRLISELAALNNPGRPICGVVPALPMLIE